MSNEQQHADWFKETWGDGTNWIGAESELSKEAWTEATKKAHMEEYAHLSVIFGQLEAGNVEDSLKMLQARIDVIRRKYFNVTD